MSSIQPNRSTMTTRRRCLSKRQPAGGSKQRLTVRVSPGRRPRQHLGRHQRVGLELVPRILWSSANDPGRSGSHHERQLERHGAGAATEDQDTAGVVRRILGDEGRARHRKEQPLWRDGGPPRQPPIARTGGGPPAGREKNADDFDLDRRILLPRRGEVGRIARHGGNRGGAWGPPAPAAWRAAALLSRQGRRGNGTRCQSKFARGAARRHEAWRIGKNQWRIISHDAVQLRRCSRRPCGRRDAPPPRAGRGRP